MCSLYSSTSDRAEGGSRDTFSCAVPRFDGNFLCISAAFFQDCISEQDLDEMNIEIIRNTLYKVKHILVMIDKVNVLTKQQQEMELSKFSEVWKVVAEMIFIRTFESGLQILFCSCLTA